RRNRNPKQVVCTAQFALEEDEIAQLAELTDQEATVETVTVTRDYEGNLEVSLSETLFPEALHPNQVDAHCRALPSPPSGLGPTYEAAASEAWEEANRLAQEGRFADLGA